LLGVSLIAAIAIGTAMMIGSFRERTLNNSERDLENTALLLAHHFDQQLEDFTVIQRDVVGQIQQAGIASRDVFREQMSTLEWHEVLKARVGTSSDVAGVSVFDSEGSLINSSEAWPV